MAEGRDGPEALVRRFDPDLHATAMFAAEPARGRLMALYGFDVELSRAARLGNAETGAMIARMRLQWWRDIVAEAEAGGAPKAHEVAGPLMRLIADGDLPAGGLEPMIAAREAEVGEAAPDAEPVAGRFAALLRAGLALSQAPDASVGGPLGHALGAAYILRNAAAMAAAGRCLLPGLGAADLAALGRGETVAGARAAARALAETGAAALAAARQRRRELPRSALPVLLTAWRAERDLRAALGPGLDLARDFPPSPGTARSLGLAWRALSGRW